MLNKNTFFACDVIFPPRGTDFRQTTWNRKRRWNRSATADTSGFENGFEKKKLKIEIRMKKN